MTEPNSEIGKRFFTSQELLRFDGDRGPMYFAYKGVVYDVSKSPRWKLGIHEGLHFPGQDLTGEMTDAPHSEAVLKSPHITIVGWLDEQ